MYQHFLYLKFLSPSLILSDLDCSPFISEYDFDSDINGKIMKQIVVNDEIIKKFNSTTELKSKNRRIKIIYARQ